jgi:acetoin utilization deacetylase AcuC-like enzyme
LSGALHDVPYVASQVAGSHDPAGEVYVGVRTPGTEVPQRAERIEAALQAAGARRVEAEPVADREALALHDPGLVGYLRSAWEEWEASGLAEDPGQDRVVPYLFPTAAMLGVARAGSTLEPARSVAARGGRYCYDTMTLIGPGTWAGARAALDVAIGAADLVAGGVRLAYALCRPPGHHATTGGFGGSCYLNNAAAAAHRLRSRIGGPVAVLDIDAHHGNGTEEIFWQDGEVLTASVHVDPAAGWFPHYAGFADAAGGGAGEGANLNLPLPPGSGDETWLEAVERMVAWAGEGGAKAMVVALGVDAEGGAPESPLEVTHAGLSRAGELLGAAGIPLVAVQEGGYELETIGALVVAALSGMAGSAR